MRAVLFEGTPEEFAKVEAMFRAGADPALQTRSIVLPQTKPKVRPEFDEEQLPVDLAHRAVRMVREHPFVNMIRTLPDLPRTLR